MTGQEMIHVWHVGCMQVYTVLTVQHWEVKVKVKYCLYLFITYTYFILIRIFLDCLSCLGKKKNISNLQQFLENMQNGQPILSVQDLTTIN